MVTNAHVVSESNGRPTYTVDEAGMKRGWRLVLVDEKADLALLKSRVGDFGWVSPLPLQPPRRTNAMTLWMP